MADVFDEAKRSEVMSRIRSTGTKPELQLAEMTRVLLGHRWRIDEHRADLPGRPDLVVPSLKLAILVDSCFFHACPRHGRIPASNRDYWEPKIARNVQRDGRTRRQLRAGGWAVWSFWSHDFKTIAARERALRRLARAIERQRATTAARLRFERAPRSADRSRRGVPRG